MAVPQWLQGVIDTYNAQFKRQYDAAVQNFYAQANQWVTNNVDNRSRGVPVTPFGLSIPKQSVAVADDSGAWWHEEILPADPALTIPELPPPAQVIPSVPFQTGAGDRDNALFKLLGTILANTEAIKGKLGL